MIIKLTKSQEKKIREEIINDFKENVVKYSIDCLRNDLLGGVGLNVDFDKYLKRLEFWIIKKEVRYGERGEVKK